MKTSNKMEICGYCLTWKTNKLEAPVGHFKESDEFFVGVKKVTKFRMRWYSEGKADDGKELFTLSLVKTGGKNTEVTCTVVCVEEHGPGYFHSAMVHHAFYERNEEVRFEEQYRAPFSSTELTIKCELSFDEGPDTVPYCASIQDFLQLSSDISAWVDHIPDTKRLALILFSEPDNHVLVHREIATCRWSAAVDLGIFFRRLKAELKVVREMVKYMYFGDFIEEETWTIEFAIKLYALALFLDVNGLQKRLLRFISLRFTKEGTWLVFKRASVLNDGGMLQYACMGFIAKHNSLFSNGEFKMFYEFASWHQVMKVLRLKRPIEAMDLPYLMEEGQQLWR